jgi:glyoxylate reductase
MARIYVTRDLPGGALDRLRTEHEVVVHAGDMPPTRTGLEAGVAEAEGLLSLLTDRVDAALIERAPRLRAIANSAVGHENVDLAAAAARGIAVGNTPDVLTGATADLTLALLLAAARQLPQSARAVRDGVWRTWDPKGWLGLELDGATLGIVGMGRIGQAVKRRAEAFGMEVVHHGRRDGVPLEQLLERSDVVSLHAPLTPETRHLIDAAALARMKPAAILVNTARGGLVDTDALTAALEGGQIAGAALDVTDPEPLPAGHPLLQSSRALVVPHVGSATHRTRERMADLAADNLLAALAGRPMPHPVALP